MEREDEGEQDNKRARNVDSALFHEGNPLESPVFCASPAFFRSLLDRVKSNLSAQLSTETG